MSQIAYPFGFDGRGRTAEEGEDEHVRHLVEQLLLTGPGERVMRPGFGCGVMQAVFAPNSPELAAALQVLVQGALQQWLGERIAVDRVEVESVDSTLSVRVSYTVRRTQSRQEARVALP